MEEDNSSSSNNPSLGLKLILKVSPCSVPAGFNETAGEGSASEVSNEVFSDISVQEQKEHKKSKKKKKKKKHDKKHRKDKLKYYESSLLQRDSYQDLSNESCLSSAGVRYRKANAISPLQRLLYYIQAVLENKDKQHFFAWPVTDNIAPGYSTIIPDPMDLSTMRHKIDRGLYDSLAEYSDDFSLMCENAMIYNYPDTVYYRAAKKLLHSGLKIMGPNKLAALIPIMPFVSEIPLSQLGFDLNVVSELKEKSENAVKCEESDVKEEVQSDVDTKPLLEGTEEKENQEVKNEAEDAELTAEEILKSVKEASEKLPKKMNNQMGFLRQNSDNTTTLSILVPGQGVNQNRERPVLLGSFVGKLSSGSSSWQPFREDKRNLVKPVKPLNYGSYGSYAPSYDSAFSNLTKEDTDLLFQTYGDEASIQYAESVLNFAKDSDYTTVMVDNLLDIMTGGEHRKTKKILEDKKRPLSTTVSCDGEYCTQPCCVKIERKRSRQEDFGAQGTVTTTANSAAVNSAKTDPSEISYLKSLSELGIDTSFVDYYADVLKEEEQIKDKLNHTKQLIEKLHHVQNERLSLPPPPHLLQVPSPGYNENFLANKITEGLSQMIKKVPPAAVASVNGVRKALGINQQISEQGSQSAAAAQPTDSAKEKSASGENQQSGAATCVPGLDLESELREFLENDTELSNFDLDDDDKTIEMMLTGDP